MEKIDIWVTIKLTEQLLHYNIKQRYGVMMKTEKEEIEKPDGGHFWQILISVGVVIGCISLIFTSLKTAIGLGLFFVAVFIGLGLTGAWGQLYQYFSKQGTKNGNE